jgi:predicted TIM-barrel fold metal-dependent hydrolase
MTTNSTAAERRAARPAVPAGACDAHLHVFGPPERYKGGPDRSYSPVERALAEYERLARELGFDRLVLVQPSSYGTDNSCQLDALKQRPDTARAVIVIDDTVDAETLRAFDKSGVRAIRLNLMTPRLTDMDAARAIFEKAAARIAPFGWHIQVYADLDIVRALAPVIRTLGVPVVFDHMAGARAEAGPAAPGFDELLDLLSAGKCWVKLSGADIVTWQNSDFSGATPFAGALIEANAAQLVWGTDWPHLVHQHGKTGDQAPPAAFRPVNEEALLDFLWQWAGTEANWKRILVDNPARLYRF